ncbi:MAG: hypothetical protein GX654_03495 [Desulfatiglans sp.]|nr:hypothetical protein [Desulfatiglans sp.]
MPVGTSININSGETYTVSRSVSISLSANGPGGGYYLSEDNTALSGETLPAFSTVASTQVLSITANFILSEDDGTKIVYVWFKDAAKNISSVISDSIILDTTTPANGAVRINDDSGSVTSSQVTVIITATDCNNIAG